MRVLHVLPSISLQQGGPTQACLSFIHNLRKEGVDAEIATTNDDGNKLLDVPLHQRVDYSDIPIWFFPRTGRMKSFIPSPSLSSWLWKYIDTYDLIHTHYLFCYVPTSTMALARFKKVPYVARTIGQLTPWALDQGKLKKKVYSNLFEKDNLNKAAAIHCTSFSEAIDVDSFGIKSPKLVLPLGVNPSTALYANSRQSLREKFGLPCESNIILFLSRLHEKKRPDLLLHALAKLNQDSQKKYYLILAGSGDLTYSAYLENLSRQLNLSDNVIFTGFVTGPDKNLLLHGADLFALPSYSENFGIAVAEALAAGLPVIITPEVQIASDIQAANAGLVVQGNLENWTNAISNLFQSPETMQRLSNNGQCFASEEYSWPAITRQLIQAYEEILAGNPLSKELYNYV